MADDASDGRGAAGPLEEAWWVRDKAEDVPPDDVPMLAPYEKTRPGFELGVIAADPGGAKFFKTVGEGFYEVCLWNIWEKETDPAETDPQKQRINQMQRALGPLDDETRFIRLQIACLQRCHYAFPENVDWIVEGIGRAEPVYKAVSCEPPWTCILRALARRPGHPAAGSGRHSGDAHWVSRQKLTRDYIRILTWWQFGGDLDSLKLELPERADLAETIYRRLGRPDKLKRLYVEKLRAALGWAAFPRPDFSEDASRELMAPCDAAIGQVLGDKPDPVGRMIEPQNLCHHAFFRRVDRQIANIGAGQRVPLPGTGQGRKRIQEAVTSYVHALGSWLAGRTPEEAASIWAPSEQTVSGVYQKLGDVTAVKRWLVACLWNQLQENQAHHGRGALDEQPERFALPPDATPEGLALVVRAPRGQIG